METFSLTQVYYPFPDLINTHVADMESYGKQLMDGYTDIDISYRESLKEEGLGEVMARFFPLSHAGRGRGKGPAFA